MVGSRENGSGGHGSRSHKFPFLGRTPSGNLKVPEHMISCENKDIAVLVSNPEIKVRQKTWKKNEPPPVPVLMENNVGHSRRECSPIRKCCKGTQVGRSYCDKHNERHRKPKIINMAEMEEAPIPDPEPHFCNIDERHPRPKFIQQEIVVKSKKVAKKKVHIAEQEPHCRNIAGSSGNIKIIMGPPQIRSTKAGKSKASKSNEDKMNDAATTIQKNIRGYLTRKHLKEGKREEEGEEKIMKDKPPGPAPRQKSTSIEVSARESPPSANNQTTNLQPGLDAPREALLVFGGTDPKNTSSLSNKAGLEVALYSVTSFSWTPVGTLPVPRTHFGIARLGDEAYIIGGTDPRYKNSNDRNAAVKSVWKVSLKTGEWSDSKDLDIPRSHFGCTAKDGKIYIFGGNDSNSSGLSSCMKYDPEQKEWLKLSSMGGVRVSMGVAVFDNHIWIAGGVSKNKQKSVRASVIAYDTERDQWSSCKSLPMPRAFAPLVVAHGKLYIVGGAGPKNKTVNKQGSLSSILRFEKDKLQWVLAGDLVVPRHGHVAATLGHQIVTVGGVNSTSKSALDSVEVYDLSTSRSHKGRNMTQVLSGMGAIPLS